MNMKETIAKALLSIQAVFLRPEDPFTWASGIKSPIYCDNRLILSYPKVRTQVEQGLAELVKTHHPDCEVIVGTATAGIPHGAIVADILDLPMAYVRGNAKDHGRENRIEGRILPGQKVVVIEDLISTGGSVLEVVEALRDADIQVLGIVSIFTYDMAKGKERFEKANITNISLTDYHTLCKVAAEEGYIKEQDLRKLAVFQQNPSSSDWMSIA